MHANHVYELLNKLEKLLDVVTLKVGGGGEGGKKSGIRLISKKQCHKWINTTPKMQFTPKSEATQPQDVRLSCMLAWSHCFSIQQCREEEVLLAAKQQQNFPKTINGQAVDSSWCFLSLFFFFFALSLS